MMYALCATPRSGSTFLQGLLQSTRIAGYPEELSPTPIKRRLLGVSADAEPAEVIEAMKKFYTTPNGVFGAQIMLAQRVSQEYDYYIHLIRKDKISQAVSLEMLVQNRTPYVNGATRVSSRASLVYDKAAIIEAFEAIETREAAWEKFFDSHKRLEVVYEDVLADPEGEVNRILLYMGLDPSEAKPIRKLTERQGDNTNIEWVERYRKEIAA